jgi:quercetin dioxygenase-like cupin family protein
MKVPAGDGGHEHSESVSLYALRALPASEVPGVEAHIASCSECQRELERIRPVVESFVSWPADVLRPSTSLWNRLAQRISEETGQAPLSAAPQPWTEAEWREVAPGISCKLLATDAERHRVSMLVRLAPGTDYPPHRHAGVEELYMLEGVLIVDDETLHPGDYRRGDPGDVDHRVWSETGCTCVLITSFHDAIL